ncbi:copper homeostasis protein CutC [Rhizobium sp. AAP43]|uniref:copper homeostasis protein CutC n=1 Tax=Rhizobium sp. AAP43 TaxID=1523420 RepID=UPI0006B8E5B6|nr:copper homeostasis protein CutC [Rhizobium sp. AAP43]KPF46115.1 copper homeostasis protein CutC [Rhizobium sp. AAP43]
MMPSLLEICVDDAEGLQAAVRGGADRIELCSALDAGGLTPSAGLMHLAARQPLPVHALIRPRSGDFHYQASEIDIILDDIRVAKEVGLAGVVIGAAQTDGRLDPAVLESLVDAASGMDLTLHRAFDLAPDLTQALDLAIALGFKRILTSGGARHAVTGLAELSRIAAAAAGRISIMPGGGVRPENAAAFLSIPGIVELHASCSQPVAVAARLVEFGFESRDRRRTDEETVRQLKQEMQRLADAPVRIS